MVNKTKFYKTKVALAVVLSLSLAACGDSDGDAGSTATTTSSTDATQNTVGNQSELSGTVQGVVVDSNANPLVGVKVYLGAAETVTNAGGQYVFTNVAVTNVNGVNNEGDEDADAITQTLVITIGGTADYLGALVTVNPQAQVNNTGGNGNTAGDGTAVNSVVTAQTFIDGFTAEAGVAVLPTLNAGTYGYIRDCRTGQPLADTADILSLDFVGLTEDISGGSVLTTAEDTHTIASDANGEFSLTGLAANSSYTISAKQGWAITSGLGLATDVNTTVTTAADLLGMDSTTVTNTTTSTGGVTVNTVTTVVVVDADDIATTTTVVTTTNINSLSTGSEGSSEFLNTIEVCPVAFTDNDVTVAPFIKSINGQIGTSTVGLTGTNSINATPASVAAQYAALNQGVVNNFVINFSEEMASTFNLAEARVKVISPVAGSISETAADATVTLSADGTSATVTFVTDLAEGSKVDVWFPHWTALDANDSKFLVDNNKIIYDTVELATGAVKAVYTHAYFCTFAKPTDIASVTLAPQIFNADITKDGLSTDLSDYSLAFQDNDALEGTLAITQLNDGDAASAARLVALAAARGEVVTIDQDYAVVEFDDSNAASLIWDVDGTAYTSTGTTVVPASTAFTIVLNGTQKEAHFNGVAHDDVVSVTPVNGFGDVVTAGKVSLKVIDAIAPTTVLQESYNITDATGPRAGADVVDGTTANAAFGNGGEISAPGTTATAAGEPIIHIQPRHLAGQTNGAADRNEELDSLTAGMSGRLTAAEVTALGGAAGAQTRMSESVIATTAAGFANHTMPIYDATAIAGWAAVPATIGTAFNEDVTLTTTAPAYSGSTTIGGYAALNNVAVNVDGQPSVVDLVTFDTPSVVALSLDAGADLGFVGSVKDSRDNVSTANAQVFIQDTFPPMITETVWDGVTLELTFNEPVTIPNAGTTIRVIDPQVTTNVVSIPVTAAKAAVAGNVLSITLTGAENTSIAPLFVNGANNEFLYNDDATASDEEQHALIDWDLIEDATGNSWSEFSPSLSVSNRGLEAAPVTVPAADTRRWEVVAPRFLAVNAVGPFTYSVATAGYDNAGAPLGGDDNGDVVYTITFTHPIDLTLSAAPVVNEFTDAINVSDGIVTPDPVTALTYSTSTAAGAAVLNGLFIMDLNGDSVADANDTFNTGVVSATVTNGSATISNGNTTVTLTISAADEAIIFGTSTFGFATNVTSAVNGLETGAGNFNWQNSN
jgi:hypothetical protein